MEMAREMRNTEEDGKGLEVRKDKCCKMRLEKQGPNYAGLGGHVKNVLVYPLNNRKPLKGSHINKTLANLCFKNAIFGCWWSVKCW